VAISTIFSSDKTVMRFVPLNVVLLWIYSFQRRKKVSSTYISSQNVICSTIAHITITS